MLDESVANIKVYVFLPILLVDKDGSSIRLQLHILLVPKVLNLYSEVSSENVLQWATRIVVAQYELEALSNLRLPLS